MEIAIKKLFDAVGIAVVGLVAMLGGIDEPMKLLFMLMVVDVIAGLSIGVFKKQFSLRKMFLGGIRKGMELAVIMVAVAVDGALGTEVWRNGAMLYYIGYEGVSLIGNLGILGVPIPHKIKALFENMRDENGGEGEAPEVEEPVSE